jgi:hypothetical protein
LQGEYSFECAVCGGSDIMCKACEPPPSRPSSSSASRKRHRPRQPSAPRPGADDGEVGAGGGLAGDRRGAEMLADGSLTALVASLFRRPAMTTVACRACPEAPVVATSSHSTVVSVDVLHHTVLLDAGAQTDGPSPIPSPRTARPMSAAVVPVSASTGRPIATEAGVACSVVDAQTDYELVLSLLPRPPKT